MSELYQALYRKYRPKSFNEVVGQDVIIKTLLSEIKADQINHSYLFVGPRGTGKTSVAKILAKTVNCKETNEGNPCNKCVSCTQINNNQTNDIVEIDAASNNGVDEIRELKSKINLVPSSSKYKVYIIDEVHMMTTQAFNALLKTLEEPPKHVIFVLATTDPQKIPLTILSRCQRFDFKKIGDTKISEKLREIANTENVKIDDQSLIEISRLSDGGMRDALSILDQVIAYSEKEVTIDDVYSVSGTISASEIHNLIENIIDENLLNFLTKIDQYYHNGKNLVLLLEDITLFLRNVLLLKIVPQYFEKKQYNIELYENTASKIELEKILKLTNFLNEKMLQLKKTNNQKLTFELIFIEFLNLKADKQEKTESVISNELRIKKLESETGTVIYNNDRADKKTLEISEPKIKDNNKINIDFETIKNIRINNALAGLNKPEMQKIIKKLSDIRNLVLDSYYCKTATIMIDSKVSAFGNNQIIYVVDDLFSEEFLNANLNIAEEIISKLTGSSYKVIATTSDNWTNIKKEFNSKTKQYKYIEDNFNIQMFAKKNKNDSNDEIAQLFGNIVKYR